MHPLRQRQVLYLAFAMATMLVGLASRRYQALLPTFVGEYSGDTLWALMLYFLVGAVCVRRPVLQRGAISLTLAFLIEFSQLYHAPWIDRLRQTVLGGLVLGFGFLWTDLICYSVGIGIGACVEWLSCQIAAKRRSQPLD